MTKPKKAHIPQGTADVLFAEAALRRETLDAVHEVFTSHGYFPVHTPTFEQAEIYSKTSQLIKWVDRDGSTLALRPDMTTSIARMTATKLMGEELPLRIQYTGSAFREEDEQVGMRQREFTQTGLELIGVNTPQADAEVIAATVKALESAGLTDFLLEIGNARFFDALMRDAGFDEERITEIKDLIDRKNIGAMEKLLQNAPIDERLKELIVNLPYQFGGMEIIDRVREYPLSEEALSAANNLAEILSLLEDYGCGNRITVDLGMVQSFDYYTGVIVKGFAAGVGFPICGGGRYDNLIGEFGEPLPATGIAIGVERLLSALRRCGAVEEPPAPHTLVCYEKEENRKTAFAVANTLRERGLIVVEQLKGEIPSMVGGIVRVLDDQNLRIENTADGTGYDTTVAELLGGDLS